MWFAVAVAVGGGIIAAANRFQPGLAEWVRADAYTRFPLVAIGVAVFAAGPPLAAGIYLWRLGNRTVRGERYPPSGTAMIHDAAVLTGPDARQRGRLLQTLGAIVALAAAGLVAVLARLVLLLESRP